MQTPVSQQATATPPHLPGWRHLNSGKVRDLYENENDPQLILLVASDRISAFDYILPTTIPGKGIILTQLSRWWFEQLQVPNHVVSYDVPEVVAGRAMICRRLQMVPIECVARGYLTGSGLVEYHQRGSVCDLPLPGGLVESSALNPAIYTPAAKAEVGQHDENVSFERTVAMVGEQLANQLRETTLDIYQRAREIALSKGIIVADTKFEFGVDEDGQLRLADEVLTPDSSRFWPADQWVEGQVTPSFDKQYVRDWLLSAQSGWDRASGQVPPPLPKEVVARTQQRYLEAYRILTGTELQLPEQISGWEETAPAATAPEQATVAPSSGEKPAKNQDRQ
ncbi:MAG: phosphoribosylaminoimidazolesuccinocarboxamide synthase [Actinomycetaceae bacterium]|nr:phosphoribosylaminoimidazolesuccinocarboxamide synthase [Actinomycetaceae bacterium]